MSSWNCFKCHERIWDKYDGYIGGTHEIKVDGKTTVVCGFCGDQDEVDWRWASGYRS